MTRSDKFGIITKIVLVFALMVCAYANHVLQSELNQAVSREVELINDLNKGTALLEESTRLLNQKMRSNCIPTSYDPEPK